jgi:exonuclease V gamma subunit
LHGFSSRYNIEAAGQIFTYLYGANAPGFDPKKTDPKEFDEIPVYSFVKFFEHPAEWYFKNILGIDHDEDEQTLPETELFGLGHLEKWQMKNDLLHTEADNLDSYFKKCVKEGKLPLKNLGRLFSEEIVTEISLLKSKYLSLTKDKTERNVAIDLNIENVRFTGTIEGVFGNEFITYAFSERLVYQVRAYLRTLLLAAQGEILSSSMIEKTGEVKTIPVMAPDDARTEIRKLLFYFLKGTQSPLKFTLNSNKPPKKGEINIETILRSIESDVTGNKNIKPPIEPDRYLRTLYEEGYYKDFNENDFEEFKAIASLLRLNEEQNEEAE